MRKAPSPRLVTLPTPASRVTATVARTGALPSSKAAVRTTTCSPAKSTRSQAPAPSLSQLPKGVATARETASPSTSSRQEPRTHTSPLSQSAFARQLGGRTQRPATHSSSSSQSPVRTQLSVGRQWP
jgi:hypothetical protein